STNTVAPATGIPAGSARYSSLVTTSVTVSPASVPASPPVSPATSWNPTRPQPARAIARANLVVVITCTEHHEPARDPRDTDRGSYGLFAEQHLQACRIASQGATLQIEPEAALPPELLAAAGPAGPAVQQRGQRGPRPGALRRHLRRSQVQPAGPRGG